MTKLVVLDFDKTILPYDSFRKLVLSNIFIFPISFGLLIIARKVKLLSAIQFKKRILTTFRKHAQYQNKMIQFAEKVSEDINMKLFQDIKLTYPDSKFILISASPHDYIHKIGQNLEIEAYGSYFESNNFIHLYGDSKIKFLQQKFPKEQFKYEFAISDSTSDLKLLSLFKNYTLLT